MDKRLKQNKAITLISLIITIIILLILAGITIGQLTGNQLFENAKLSAEEQTKAQIVEDITLKIIDIQMEDTKNNEKTTFKSLHDKLPIKNNKVDMDDYIEGDEELTGVYNTGKKQYEFIIDDKYNVILGNIVKGNRKKFDVEISDIDENSFIVSAKQEDLSDMQVEKYTYIVEAEGNKKEIKDITEATKKIEGLQSGTQYTVKMIAYDNQENARESKTKIVKTLINVESIKGTIVITPSTEEWTNQDIEVVVEWGKSDSGVKKEISIDGGSTYKEYTEPVQVEKNTKVVAKITVDGTEITKELTIENIDKLNPNGFTPVIKEEISSTDLKIDASNATDAVGTEEYGSSGIKKYEYFVYKDGELIDKSEKIDDNYWTVSGLITEEVYDIYVNIYDEADNKTTSSTVSHTKQYVWFEYKASENKSYTITSNTQTSGANVAEIYNYHYVTGKTASQIFNRTTGYFTLSSSTIKGSSSMANYIVDWGSRTATTGTQFSTIKKMGSTYKEYTNGSVGGFSSKMYHYDSVTYYSRTENTTYGNSNVRTSRGVVSSINSGEYPTNAYQDGYWYVKQ